MAKNPKDANSSEATSPGNTAAVPSKTTCPSELACISEKAAACPPSTEIVPVSSSPERERRWRSKPSSEDVEALKQYQLALRAVSALMGHGFYSSVQMRNMMDDLREMGVDESVIRDMGEHFAMNRSGWMQDFMG